MQRWAGEVIIADPLTLPQAELIQDGFKKDEPDELINARNKYFLYIKEHGEEGKEAEDLRLNLLLLYEKNRQFYTVADKRQLPAIFACVEKWDLSNFPKEPSPQNFPMSPREDSHKLIDWLFSEIKKVYYGEAEIPNESSPTLTGTQAKDSTAEK